MTGDLGGRTPLTNTNPAAAGPYEPARPALLATGVLSLWVAVLSLPMLTGEWLATEWSDQYAAGYAFRTWGAEWWGRLGHVPLWNPERFAGLPFVAALHGDVFYPTSFLRLLLPTATAMNFAFAVHYVLAGLLTYALLRLLRVSWTGAIVGAIAYQLSGIIGSYPQPGHDGKLFVSTMLPLAFIGLVLALRDRRASGYALLAVAIGLSLLAPHFQMAYYLLLASGLFALYLTFGDAPPAMPVGRRIGSLGMGLGAVVLGFGLAMVQILPFFQYLPFSPRAAGYHDFAASASYAIPWEHVPEFFVKNFVGSTPSDTYWGSNALKLHSEYLGLPVIALAVLGAAASEWRRLALWLGGITLLFLLIGLGDATPFYRVWWEVMPYVKKTRAPGMSFFIVAFIVSLCAGIGAQRLERREGTRHLKMWLAAAAVIALLGVTGVFGAVARAFADGHQAALGPRPGLAARAAAPAMLWGALTSAVSLAAVAGLGLGAARGRVNRTALAFGLAAVVGTDLWLNARNFWAYSMAHREFHRLDPVTERIKQTPPPYRVLDLGVYPRSGEGLMALDIPQLLGESSNEIRFFDDALGGRNEWRNLGYRPLWDLFAVRFVIAPAGARGLDSLPGYARVLDSMPTSGGVTAQLFERDAPQAYARVVPAGVKADPRDVLAALLDPRMDYSRVVLFTPDQPVAPPAIDAMPPPSPSQASVTAWEPGRMAIALDPAPVQPSYVLVSENFYPDWRATVDGTPATVLRGDYTLITVAVPAGARRVELTFRSRDYELGRAISLASLVLIVAVAAGPLVRRRRA